MPDYECHPLWHYDSDRVGNIDPTSLPISTFLTSELSAWASEYDSTLNRENPLESAFKNKESEVNFVAKGYELAMKLKNELKGVSIVYYDINQKRERNI